MASPTPIRLVTRAAFLAAIVPLSAKAQSPAKWRLEPIATIEGVSDADPFSRIRNIALHADGRLVVVDDKVKTVSMFDGAGKSLGVVGRIGGGPGEYRDPYATAWLADTLAIFDPREARIVFLANGKVPLRTELSAHLTGGSQVRFYPVSRTKAYLLASKRVGNKLETVYIGFGGGAQDTIMPPSNPQTPSATMCKDVSGNMHFFSWPEAARGFSFPVRSDGAFAMGNTGDYKITIRSAGAPLATIVRNDLVPLPLEDFMWEQENAEYRAHVAKFGAASCESTPIRPPYRAPIRSIAVADNGDIWIMVHGKSEYGYNVFSRDGKFLATVPAANRVVLDIPITIAGDRLAYVEDDRDGVQVVKTFRIVK